MNSPNDCFAFCFWAIGKGGFDFGPLGKGMNSSIDCLLSVSHVFSIRHGIVPTNS